MTAVLRVDPRAPERDAIARAADCLRNGGLVAFPTETVYGLGVHALDREALLRLFAAKQRPANDPLIVHVTSIEDLAPLIMELPPQARTLAARFWPGPLTMVLRRSPAVPDEVTAGLATVGLRLPAHPVARALIAAAGVPIAAPSANLFSRPSPTEASHVIADLDGRIDMVIDGGPTVVGVESTVLDLSQDPAVVLRPGAIGIDALREVIPRVTLLQSTPSGGALPSPGLLSRHYSPSTPLALYEGDRGAALRLMRRDAQKLLEERKRIIVLVYAEDAEEFGDLTVSLEPLGSEQEPDTVAARLYGALRESDQREGDVILVRTMVGAHALTAAINDRLRRASAGRIVRQRHEPGSSHSQTEREESG